MEEVRDRFGPLPSQAEWLHKITRIRLFAARHQFSLLKLSKVVLLAEQTHDKKNKISKKILVKLPKTPLELEQTVIHALKENFPLKK